MAFSFPLLQSDKFQAPDIVAISKGVSMPINEFKSRFGGGIIKGKGHLRWEVQDLEKIMEYVKSLDLNRPENKKVTKSAFRAGATVIKKREQERVKQIHCKSPEFKNKYPGRKRKYPNQKGHVHGMLRGVDYGALTKDIKVRVYRNGGGANVSLYSQKKQNRWCVLMWLNEGTSPRGTKRSTYQNTYDYGYKQWRYKGQTYVSMRRATGKAFAASNGANRGQIPAMEYFLPTAKAALAEADMKVGKRLVEGICKNFQIV